MDSNFELTQPFSPQTIEEWKEIKITQLYAEQKSRLDSFLLLGDGHSLRSQGETLVWNTKVAQAKLFQDTGSLSDCPLLVTETKARLTNEKPPTAAQLKKGVQSLAQTLIEKEPQLQEASSWIVGRAGRFKQMIEDATSIEEVQAINLAEGWE
jgi:hypothetical protein